MASRLGLPLFTLLCVLWGAGVGGRSLDGLLQFTTNRVSPPIPPPRSDNLHELRPQGTQKSRAKFHFAIEENDITTSRAPRNPKTAEQIRMEYLYHHLANRHRSGPPPPGTCLPSSYRSRALATSVESGSLCTGFSWFLPESVDSKICFAEMWFSASHFLELINETSRHDLLGERARLQVVADGYESSVADLKLPWSAVASHRWIVIDASKQVRQRDSVQLCIRNSAASNASADVLSASIKPLNHHQMQNSHLQQKGSMNTSPFSVSGERKAVSLSIAQFIRDHSARLRKGSLQFRGAPNNPDTTARRSRRSTQENDTIPPYDETIPDQVEIEPGPAVALDLCQRRSLFIHLPDYLDDVEVIKPKNLDIYDCMGSCDVGGGPPATSHAFFMQLVRLMEPLSSEPRSMSCCVPAQFEPEEFLLLARNENNVTDVFPLINPIVTGCGCS